MYTLSYGMNVALLAMLSVMVEKSQTTRIFMISNVAQIIGAMIGMPLMGALYAVSSGQDSKFPGAPFDFAAVSSNTHEVEQQVTRGTDLVCRRSDDCHCNSKKLIKLLYRSLASSFYSGTKDSSSQVSWSRSRGQSCNQMTRQTGHNHPVFFPQPLFLRLPLAVQPLAR